MAEKYGARAPDGGNWRFFSEMGHIAVDHGLILSLAIARLIPGSVHPAVAGAKRAG